MTRHKLALGSAALLLVASGAGGATVASHLWTSAASLGGGSGAGLIQGAPRTPAPPHWHRGRTAAAPTTQATVATAAQSKGLVEITSALTDGTSSGTGLILGADGTVVTNHHVVEGATAIRVTDVSTGRTYRARYVGGNATTDVAVLRLVGAGGLTPVRFSSTPAAVGDPITAVGDAGGDGGALTAATGTVAALHDDITVDKSDGGSGSPLTDLIRMNAYIIPGDSGGAVLDGDGDVVGMNVAASSTGTTGYAIPIATVETVAKQITDGVAGNGVRLGYDGYLGVALDSSAARPLVVTVTDGSAALKAGIVAGDTITRVDGRPVRTAEALRAAISAHSPGARVVISWTTAAGHARSATVTLGTGPVD